MSRELKKVDLQKGVFNLMNKFYVEKNSAFKVNLRFFLFLFVYNNSPIDLKKLKEYFYEISYATLNEELKQLVMLDFIEKTSENYDQREKTYALTDRGWDLVNEWMDSSVVWDE